MLTLLIFVEMKLSKKRAVGVVMAIAGIMMFSAKAIFVKLMYSYDVSTIKTLLLRMLFAFPLYLIMAFIYKPKKDKKQKNQDYISIIILGFIGYYLASLFDFMGLQYISASLERIILFIYPTLVLIISAILLKTKINTSQIIAVLLTYTGVLLAFYGEMNYSTNAAMIGGGFILLSALTYALYLVGSQWLIPKFGVNTFTTYVMIVSCILVIIHYAIIDRSSLLGFPRQVYFLGFAMAVISTFIPSYLISGAIKRLGAADFAILAGLGPILTIFFAHLFLGEELNYKQAIGAFLVVAGVYFISAKKKEKPSP